MLIAAVSTDPNNQKLLLCNTEMFPSIRIIRTAVAREDGDREFFFSKGKGMRSSFRSRPSDETMIVKTHRIDSLLETMKWEHADLIKFDIEGAEWEVFEGAPLQKISSLI